MLPLFLLWPTDIVTTPLIWINISVPEIPPNALSCLCSAVGPNSCSLISVKHMHYWVNHKLQRIHHFYQIQCSNGTYFTCGINVSFNHNLKYKKMRCFPFVVPLIPVWKQTKETKLITCNSVSK